MVFLDMPAKALASVARVLRLSSETFEEAVDAATRVLFGGGIVALPTDTVYGVSTLIQHSDKLYDLKRRSHAKPLGLFISSPEDIPKYAQLTISPSLANKLLPGPVTLIFERSDSLPPFFNPDTANVGVRVPESAFVSALCRKVGQPLAQTSANVSGSSTNPLCLDDFADLLPEVDLAIDGGLIGTEVCEGSTIVDLTTPGYYKIVRDGCALLNTVELLQSEGLCPE